MVRCYSTLQARSRTNCRVGGQGAHYGVIRGHYGLMPALPGGAPAPVAGPSSTSSAFALGLPSAAANSGFATVSGPAITHPLPATLPVAPVFAPALLQRCEQAIKDGRRDQSFYDPGHRIHIQFADILGPFEELFGAIKRRADNGDEGDGGQKKKRRL